jgi:phage recombination protein Bet
VSTAIAVRSLTDDQIDLIRRTLCKDASPEELELFVAQCNRTGLDPLSRQIHAVKRGGRLAIMVGIDGFRPIASRTGEADGQDGPQWCGTDGRWRDVWLDKGPPAACRVVVYRKGQARGYTGVALLSEYRQPGPVWDRMPSVMLAKVAESIALRKAFPQELSGLYAPEEMPADAAPAEARPAAPTQAALPAAGVRRRDAAPSASTVGVLDGLIRDVAEIEGSGSEDVRLRLFAALRFDAPNLEGLDPNQRARAAEVLRLKLVQLQAQASADAAE